MIEDIAVQFRVRPSVLIGAAKRAIARQRSKQTAAQVMDLLLTQGDELLQKTAERIGLTLRSADVCMMIDLSKSAVHKAKAEDRIFAYRLEGTNHDVFPALQFDGGKIRDWVAPLLADVGNGTSALVFLTARRATLDGSSYAERLQRTPKDVKVIATMLHTAASYARPSA